MGGALVDHGNRVVGSHEGQTRAVRAPHGFRHPIGALGRGHRRRRRDRAAAVDDARSFERDAPRAHHMGTGGAGRRDHRNRLSPRRGFARPSSKPARLGRRDSDRGAGPRTARHRSPFDRRHLPIVMADTIPDLSREPKHRAYPELFAYIVSTLVGIDDDIAGMATISSMIHYSLGHLWTGFYRVVAPNLLRVGPYQGSLGCLEIPFGKGVC